MTITTTLNRVRDHSPCRAGWEKLLKGLGKTAADDEPLPFSRIVEINGIDDAIWCMRVEPQHDQQWRLFVVFCCRQIKCCAKGEATKEEPEDAWVAAQETAWKVAGAAAWEAAWKASQEAERAVGRAAAWEVAREAQRKELLRVVS